MSSVGRRLLVILGPTGAGKSGIAEEIARRAFGEIISADAFAVYRGLDIGTAKPTRERRAEVSYHLVDVAEPGEAFSAGRWATLAERAASEIAARGRLPIVCGGSGFYVQALLDGLPPGEAKDPRLRSLLSRWAERDPQAARRFLEVNDTVSAARIAPGNLRYTVRALEILLVTGRAASQRVSSAPHFRERWRVITVGIALERADLYAKIEHRVREMLDAGWVDEVRGLLESGLSFDSPMIPMPSWWLPLTIDRSSFMRVGLIVRDPLRCGGRADVESTGYVQRHLVGDVAVQPLLRDQRDRRRRSDGRRRVGVGEPKSIHDVRAEHLCIADRQRLLKVVERRFRRRQRILGPGECRQGVVGSGHVAAEDRVVAVELIIDTRRRTDPRRGRAESNTAFHRTGPSSWEAGRVRLSAAG